MDFPQTNEGLWSYVQIYLGTPTTPNPSNKRFFRISPLYDRLRKSIRNPQAIQVLEKLVDVEDDETLLREIDTVVGRLNTFDAGVATGYALGLSDEEITGLPGKLHSPASPYFLKGVREGSAYLNLSMSRIQDKKMKRGFKALFGSVLCGTLLSRTQESITPEQNEAIKTIIKAGLPLIVTSSLYGQAVMIWSKLFGNDGENSEKLITQGPFRMHRNPFYASMMFSVGVGATMVGSMNAIANPLTIPLGIAGLAAFVYAAKQNHDYALLDEERLETLFGEEYRTYKKETPRYFPAFWKLLRRKKKK